MTGAVLSLLTYGAALIGATLVAIVATIAIRRFIAGLEAALGLSMLLMGVVLHSTGLFTGEGPWPVVIIVAVSHAIAGWAIWHRQKLHGA
ncbi:MAG: hypothetical protein JWR10_955 [Rubritepida sp.]|nr:hypothetical protein [Rubritepida sp.]